MDEAIEAVDTVADSGFEGVLTWMLRRFGLVALFAGLGLWLLTDMGLLVVPAVLIVVGVACIVAPTLLLTLVEIAGCQSAGVSPETRPAATQPLQSPMHAREWGDRPW